MGEEEKWYQSRTIWGAIIALVAFVFTFFGVTIVAEEQATILELVVQIATPMGALVGVILTIIGRVKATKSIKMGK